MIIRKSLLALLTTAFLCSSFAGGGIGEYDYSDSIDASRSHPGSDSIAIEKVPMFICFGWDDNGIADLSDTGGATWIREYLKDKENPVGANQSETHDGTPMRSSFYFTGKYAETWVYESHLNVRKAWDSLYADGHEVGNHSTNHLMKVEEIDGEWIVTNFNGREYTKEEWLTKEIDSCHSTLTKTMKFPAADIIGWRTPRLEWNNALFEALTETGFVYDCSIESDPSEDGTSHYWPHTLNKGTPLSNSVTSHPGMWQLPAYRFVIPEELQAKAGVSVVTGLDYNVWVKKGWGGLELSGPDFTEILKHNLDLRMEGNRCPMLIGLHSDVYSSKKDADYPSSGGAAGRQKAIEDFVEYAEATYPEIRFVTGLDIIKWMRNPKPLGETAVTQTKVYKEHGITVASVSDKFVSISVPSAASYKVQLFTAQGKQVATEEFHTSAAAELPLSIEKFNLTSGVYMVQVESNGSSMVEKINIQ